MSTAYLTSHFGFFLTEKGRQALENGGVLCRLPSPIFNKVLSYLSQNDINHLSLTCRAICLVVHPQFKGIVKEKYRSEDLPPFVLAQAKIGITGDFLNPKFSVAYALFQKTLGIDPKQTWDLAAWKTYWLKENFPEMAQSEEMKQVALDLKKEGVNLPHHFSELAKEGHLAPEPRIPLSSKFKFLCIGGGTEGENSRNHDPKTTYTINLHGAGNPHVSDNIALLPQRRYLNIGDTPHRFETIYIEVSCGQDFFIYPEMFHFLRSHLTEGGKLIIEMNVELLNPSLGLPKPIFRNFYPLFDSVSWEDGQEERFEEDIATVIFTYNKNYNEVGMNFIFQGDWQDYFKKLGFSEVQVSQTTKPCNMGSRPIEMTYHSKSEF